MGRLLSFLSGGPKQNISVLAIGFAPNSENIGLEAAGVQVMDVREALMGKFDKPRDRLPTDKGCADLIASVPQLLFANLATASAMLNALLLYLSGVLHYSECCFDIADGLMRPVPIPAPILAAASPAVPAPAAET